jgi:flagellar basal-body rod protein FlgB
MAAACRTIAAARRTRAATARRDCDPGRQEFSGRIATLRAKSSTAADSECLARLLLIPAAALYRAWNATTMESILGIHEAALLYRAKRMDVLAANLANADTPHYQARDLDFSSALDGAFAGATRLKATDPRHIALDPLSRGDALNSRGDALKYRVPHQPSLDGNTVESDLEQARYAENAVSYQASLLFAGNRISTLRAALTGGR